ncbi:hypothetical protein T439DRAFT_357702 [Meredithblackwellia eburnea MCA 4105]
MLGTTVTLIGLLVAASTFANAATTLSTCQLSCAETAATNSSCGASYNSTACGCSTDFRSASKACIYADCADEVQAWYSILTELCDGGSIIPASGASATATATASSATGTNGLTTCQTDCATSAFTNTTCGTSYTSTDCGCNDDFRTDVKKCLYSTSGCSGDVLSWYEYLDKFTCPSAATTGGAAQSAASTATVIAASASSTSTAKSGASSIHIDLRALAAIALAALGGATLI